MLVSRVDITQEVSGAMLRGRNSSREGFMIVSVRQWCALIVCWLLHFETGISKLQVKCAVFAPGDILWRWMCIECFDVRAQRSRVPWTPALLVPRFADLVFKGEICVDVTWWRSLLQRLGCPGSYPKWVPCMEWRFAQPEQCCTQVWSFFGMFFFFNSIF